ncbi:MAG: PH domain-containing protein [Arenimonas sp.]
MNEESDAPAAPAPAAQSARLPFGEWQPLPNAAATTAMYGGSAFGLLLGAGACGFIGWPMLVLRGGLPWWQGLLLVLVLWLLFGVAGAALAYRRWKSTSWKLDDTGLHLRRGWIWRKQVLVPRSRVQHLDIERGPIDRHYGLAKLIVHTAGTRQHGPQLPGLADADAVALRDALVPDASRPDDVL